MLNYLLIIMKHIHVPFEDGEYKKLLKAKGSMSWHTFILTLVKGGKK